MAETVNPEGTASHEQLPERIGHRRACEPEVTTVWKRGTELGGSKSDPRETFQFLVMSHFSKQPWKQPYYWLFFTNGLQDCINRYVLRRGVSPFTDRATFKLVITN